MPKWFKTVVAVGLLPFCVGATHSLARVCAATRQADRFWVAVFAGAAGWLTVYGLLPKPMRVYVFGHELTHALWAWASGGTVKRFKVTAAGGEVVTNRNHFLVVLAPYFFPLYAVGAVGLFLVGDRWWGWQSYAPLFHVLVGAAYAFHVTMTWHVLQARQSDITRQGYLFSGAVVWLGNVLVLLVLVPLISGAVEVQTGFLWFGDWVVRFLAGVARVIAVG